MMLKRDWRKQTRVCHCSAKFAPKREGQRHCSASCRDVAAKRRRRSGRSMDKKPTPTRSMDTPFSDAPTVSEMSSEQKETQLYWEGGPLQGDDYALEYY